MSDHFNNNAVLAVGYHAEQITKASSVIYWLASHNVDVAFHVADLEKHFDELAKLIADLRRSRLPQSDEAAA